MLTVGIIKAKGAHFAFRMCKGCRREIENGELCVRYKRAHKTNYHCWECAERYNREVINDYEQQYSDVSSF